VMFDVTGGFLQVEGFQVIADSETLVESLVGSEAQLLSQYPLGFGQWLQALVYALSKPREIAIVGDPEAADTQALLSVVRGGYRPFQVVALWAPGAQPPAVPAPSGSWPAEWAGRRLRVP
jgi:hypothetical protein